MAASATSSSRRHPDTETYLIIKHDIDFLRVEPALTILIAVANDEHLVVVGGELDMAITLLHDSVERSDLVLPRIPVFAIISSALVRLICSQTDQRWQSTDQ